MRIDILKKINLGGYEEFETVAGRYGFKIQEHLKLLLSSDREAELDIANQHSTVVSQINHTLKFVRPAPDQVQRKIAEKSFIFGMQLGALLSRPYDFEFGTDNFKNGFSQEDIQLYIDYAPNDYLRHRPKISKLIDRNLLQPIPDASPTTLVRNMAGLAVMQCEEGRLEAFMRREELKLADDLLERGGILPVDWR